MNEKIYYTLRKVSMYDIYNVIDKYIDNNLDYEVEYYLSDLMDHNLNPYELFL